MLLQKSSHTNFLNKNDKNDIYIYVNQVVSSKHAFLSFKPLKHQLIKGPNKQKTNMLFLRFDILSLSTILSFHIEFTIP